MKSKMMAILGLCQMKKSAIFWWLCDAVDILLSKHQLTVETSFNRPTTQEELVFIACLTHLMAFESQLKYNVFEVKRANSLGQVCFEI